MAVRINLVFAAIYFHFHRRLGSPWSCSGRLKLPLEELIAIMAESESKVAQRSPTFNPESTRGQNFSRKFVQSGLGLNQSLPNLLQSHSNNGSNWLQIGPGQDKGVDTRQDTMKTAKSQPRVDRRSTLSDKLSAGKVASTISACWKSK